MAKVYIGSSTTTPIKEWDSFFFGLINVLFPLDCPFPSTNPIRSKFVVITMNHLALAHLNVARAEEEGNLSLRFSVSPKTFPNHASVSRHVFFPDRAVTKTGRCCSTREDQDYRRNHRSLRLWSAATAMAAVRSITRLCWIHHWIRISLLRKSLRIRILPQICSFGS